MMANKTSKPSYTEDEIIRRVWDIEEVKKLMAKRGLYVANDMRREELNDLWVAQSKHRETASLGSNWGYYVGMDAIQNYYVEKHIKDRQKLLDEACKANTRLENRKENLGYGCMSFHPVSTAVVVLADDGKTAKGNWYVVGGQESIWKAGGSADCHWYYDRMAADFVKEDDGWKIWHLVISNDLHFGAGGNLNAMPAHPPSGSHPAEVEFLSGNPTVRMITHNPVMNYCDQYPLLPEPYFTYEAENGYGPEGHPKCQKKEERVI